MYPMEPIIYPLHEDHDMGNCYDHEPKPTEPLLSRPPLAATLATVAILWSGINTYYGVKCEHEFRAALAEEALCRKASAEANLCITNAYVDGLYRKVQSIEMQQANATPEQFEQLKLWHKIGDEQLQQRINQLLASQKNLSAK